MGIQKNVIGEVFGELTVIEEMETHITPNGSRQRNVKVKCSCGNVFVTRLTTAKKSLKCKHCLAKDRRIDITGKKYGKLTVISMAEDYISPNGNRLSRCNCLCDCGNEVSVLMSGLVTGTTKSCGCIKNTAGLLRDNKKLMEKYDFEKNSDINLEGLTARSSKKIWWKCNKCGNSWFATIASQNDKIVHGCPYCSGRIVTKGKNDLLSQYPELVEKNWDYEKNNIKPDEISCFSGQKVWWICEEGHSWKASVRNKVNGSGCPRCNIENVNSFCEQAVFYYIKQAFPDAINGDNHIGMELDIFIPSKRIAIEYDGEAWHLDKKKELIDKRKNELCKNNNIELIRIREPKLKLIDNCKCFIRNDSTSSNSLDKVIVDLLEYLNVYHIDVDTKADITLILEQFATKKNYNSLAYLYPEIAAEWHPTKNGKLTPDKVNKASRFIVWWQGKCGHEWQMRVNDRTRNEYHAKDGRIHKPQGCPYCSSKKILVGYNDLATKYPEIAAEWHPTKNGELKPTDVLPGSHKKIWWLGKCGHEWQSQPNKRCNDNSQCPICYRINRSPAVICIETNETFDNAEEAGKKYNIVNYRSIYKCCRGEIKTTGGYHWQFLNK